MNAGANSGDDPPVVALLTPEGQQPAWAPNGDLPFRVEVVTGTGADAAAEERLVGAAAVVIDAAVGAPLSVARRAHRLAPTAQLVVVAHAEAMQDLRRAMLFTPGIGEVWLVEPEEATADLFARAVGIGRTRSQHAEQVPRMSDRVASLAGRGNRRVLLADQYLATLLELLPDPVLALDADDAVVFANPAASALLGSPNERRISGTRLREALGSSDAGPLDRLLEEGRRAVARGDFRIEREGGSRVLHASVAPVAGERPVRAVVLHDVTDAVLAREQLQLQADELTTQREELQAQNEELTAQAEELASQAEELAHQNEQNRRLAAEREAVLGHIADGVVIADAEGRVIFLNAAARRIHASEDVGVEAADWSSRYGLFDLHGDPLPPEALPLYRALKEGVPVRDAEWQIRWNDGTRIWAQGSAAPVVDEGGRSLGAVLTVRDVTEKRARDEERERLLVERNQAVSDLEHAMKSRSRFYASMSHELRTPINAIIGYNDLLRTGVYGDVPPDQEVALERVHRAANHLLELINDVLDLSKIEAGKLAIVAEPIDIAEMISDMRATMQPLAESHDSELRFAAETTCETPFTTDPRRLRQILMNLISNAIRYGGGSPVDVRCAVGDDRLRISVSDEGPGIPADRLEDIFEEFVQVTPNDPGGTGLGLPIAQALAHLLGGEIRVESEVGVGSTFSVILPRLAVTADEETPDA